MSDMDNGTPVEIDALSDGGGLPLGPKERSSQVDSQLGGPLVSDTVRQIHAWFRASRSSRAKWRSEAAMWYRFYKKERNSRF